jgi:hypothetical protein
VRGHGCRKSRARRSKQHRVIVVRLGPAKKWTIGLLHQCVPCRNSRTPQGSNPGLVLLCCIILLAPDWVSHSWLRSACSVNVV